MKKRAYEIIAVIFILLGTGLLCFLIFLFAEKIQEPVQFDLRSKIDSSIFNDFGSLTAGTVGILWYLAGVFLLIASLREQKRATDENIKSIRLQQFENTFFQLITVHYEIVKSLKVILQDEYGMPEKEEGGNVAAKDGIMCFVALSESIGHKYRNKQNNNININRKNFQEICSEQFYIYNAELGHYFGNFFNILNYIHSSSDISMQDKLKFVKILKSQLSNYELVIILYYDMIKPDKDRRLIIEKYQLLSNLDFEMQYSADYEKTLVDPEIFLDSYPHLKKSFTILEKSE